LKAILQVAHQNVRIIAQQDGCDTLVAGGHEDGAKRTLRHGEMQHLVGAATLVAARRHAEHRRGLLVKASAGIETGFMHGSGHAVAFNQRVA
jgi:hypothetical protein